MKAVVSIFIVVVALCFLPFDCLSDSSLSVRKDKVVAAYPRHFPPLYNTDDHGRPAGFGIDIMDAIARRANLDVEYRAYSNWTTAAEALVSGEADVIPDIGIAAERQTDMIFSRPTNSYAVSFFALTSRSDISDRRSLEGTVIGVAGTTAAVRKLQQSKDVDLVFFDCYDASLLALFSGTVDAIVHPAPVAWRKAHQLGLAKRIKELEDPIMTEIRGVSVRLGREDLLSRIDLAVQNLVGSSEYEDIHRRWYGWNVPFWTAGRVALGSGIILLVVVAALLYWRFHSLRRSNAALRKSEERYRRLYFELPQPYQSVDEDGYLLEVNDAWGKMLGYDREEVLGSWFGDLVAEESRPVFRENFARFKTAGTLHVDACGLLAKDGSRRTAAIDGRVAHGAEGRILQTHCILTDVTEREDLERKLIQSQKMEAVGELTGGVAHDFNNLLQVIETNLELARALIPESPQLEELVEAALQAERRGAELTQKLLTFSRKQALRASWLDVNAWLEDETRLLVRTLGEDIAIISVFAEGDFGIVVDESGLSNALLNIAVNARTAMPKGGTLTIAVDRRRLGTGVTFEHDTLPPGTYIEIAVTDTGVGMPEDVRRRAFEPFFTTKGVGKGSGLGLSMVYGFARQSGGDGLHRKPASGRNDDHPSASRPRSDPTKTRSTTTLPARSTSGG